MLSRRDASGIAHNHDLDLLEKSKSMNTIMSKKNLYPPLNAFTILSLATRSDGKKPPTNPIITAKQGTNCTPVGI